MTISDWLVIAAIVIAPILAIRVQKIIEKYIEKKQRKLQIFKTLMATRGSPVSPPHVEALNMVDLEFYREEKKDKIVMDAWEIYLDHLNNFSSDPKDPNYQTQADSWLEKSRELLINLLFEMAKSLNYNFDKVHLKRAIYSPRGPAEIEFEQSLIRRSFVDILLGKKAFPISISETKSETKEQIVEHKEKEK